MSLGEKLRAINDGAKKGILADRLAIMHRATDELRASGIMDRVLKVGARVEAVQREIYF